MNMKINYDGIQRIKRLEGWRESQYLDAVGLPTIGYGHLIRINERFPNKLSQIEGDRLLIKDIIPFENKINKIVKVKLNQNQFNVLVSFLFNLGVNALDRTTSLKVLNSGDYKSFANRLLMWNKGMINGKLTVIQGLNNRRIEDRKIFLEGIK